MKIKLAFLALGVACLALTTDKDSSGLSIGDKAPKSDMMMKDVSGKEINLNKIKGEKGLLVIFSCNTCPFVVGNGSKSEGWENRYNDLTASATKAGIGTVLVNSNEAKRDAGDSFKDMVKRSEEQKFQSYYTLDQKHALADAFGAKTTPHVFLFDADMTLVYQGAIDDNVNRKKEVKLTYLEDAMSAVSMGKEVKVKETKPVGCSIKRIAAK